MNDTQREERDRQDNMRFVARAMLIEHKVIRHANDIATVTGMVMTNPMMLKKAKR